ncbi:MAG: hypothetical protein KAG34_02935 [Cocleimonas sp.]|nr:hypothetical protein [Cocleimonas sp.]
MNIPTTLLLKIGFLAVKFSNFKPAELIFISLKNIESENAAGSIGLASIAMSKGNMEEAIEYLDEIAFSKVTNAHEAKKLLLIASMLHGDQEQAGKIHHSLAIEKEETLDDARILEAEEFFSQN